MGSRRSVHVAAALVAQGGRVLACERSYGPHRGFELPGGKVEPGETPLAACLRELREELAVDLVGMDGASQPRHLATIRYDYDDFALTMDVFLGTPREGERPRALEHAQLRWLGPDELFSVEWLPADIDFLKGVRARWDELVGPRPPDRAGEYYTGTVARSE